jgi:hypothetical protein
VVRLLSLDSLLEANMGLSLTLRTVFSGPVLRIHNVWISLVFALRSSQSNISLSMTELFVRYIRHEDFYSELVEAWSTTSPEGAAEANKCNSALMFMP